MPSKKKKYNARFPAGRIKKIMQTDEEIGKVAQAVPVIISRTLELFVESLLKRAMQITSAKNAKTLTPTHMKQCILSESRFDFLKDLVKGIPDVSSCDDEFPTPSSGSVSSVGGGGGAAGGVGGSGSSGGSLSPATPLSAKGYGSYSCFQFHHQASDSSSSRSSGATSQLFIPQPSQPKFYKEIPIGSSEDCGNNASSVLWDQNTSGSTALQHVSNHCPYLPPSRTTEGSPSLLKTISGRNITQLNELRLSNCIRTSVDRRVSSEKEEVRRESKTKVSVEEEDGDDDDDEEEDRNAFQIVENGFHKDSNISRTCIIDEDYDT